MRVQGPVNERGLPAAALDAVTLDANGTLVRLRNPVPALRQMLAAHGIELSPGAAAAAFAAEARHYYADHCVHARDWDVSLHAWAEELGLTPLVDAVVASSDAGAGKSDPAIFTHALDLLGVEPGRALHVGDQPADEEGAAAARMRFAPVPLKAAFATWL
jgi:beta-phosphoglucomutase-like phosphatase (HAD superfamily)